MCKKGREKGRESEYSIQVRDTSRYTEWSIMIDIDYECHVNDSFINWSLTIGSTHRESESMHVKCKGKETWNELKWHTAGHNEW